MKKMMWSFLALLLAGTTFAQNKVPCLDWKVSETKQLYMPAFAEQGTVDGKKFERSTLLEKAQPDVLGLKSWSSASVASDSIVRSVNGKDQLVQLAGSISTDRWVKTSMSINTNGLFELYLDGKKMKTQSSPSASPVNVDLTLDNGHHQLLLKMLSTADTLRLAAGLKTVCDSSKAELTWNLDPTRTMTIAQVVDGETIYSNSMSPSGKYLLLQGGETLTGSGKVIRYSRIIDLETSKTVFALRNGAISASWLPNTDRLAYVIAKDDASDVYLYDLKSGSEQLVASNINGLNSVSWSPTEDFVIYSVNEKADEPGDLKRVLANDDRIPGSRNRSYLGYYNLKTGLSVQLTAGSQSTWLHDIKPDGTKILFSASRVDYTQVPFSKTNLYEMDLATFKLDTILKDQLYGGNCSYSPDGKSLLVTGAPETFGDLGLNVSEGRIANSFDRQLFLFDLATRKAEALSRDFNPSIEDARWTKTGAIYLSVTEDSYRNLYRFDLKKRTYTKMNLPFEVLRSFDLATNKPVAAVRGSSINTPEKLFSLDLTTGKTTLLLFPNEQAYADMDLGKTENWSFVNQAGTTISGAVYYPINYDPARKYPVIVYYYGGTTPTDRGFGGRYPKNIWAARGYLVYVLQPSGAIGFGQDFSALHVNGWGRDAIDDIIEGTKKFLAAHPAADAANVGCIGASYGGFTTMTLQTRTDIFKTAISHAGISDITSYWGEGYWGYSYSTTASKNAYPWNRREVYVDNSPLFNADKFKNSILLLHGTADTNVPTGESLQFFAALKILGKDVEMVLIDGEDHFILDYKKRLKWNDTILSWFDKKLKDQPDQWNELYPEKKF